jgi:hypothetical protein
MLLLLLSSQAQNDSSIAFKSEFERWETELGVKVNNLRQHRIISNWHSNNVRGSTPNSLYKSVNACNLLLEVVW